MTDARMITYRGKTMSLADWAKHYGYHVSTMRKMLSLCGQDMDKVDRHIKKLIADGKRKSKDAYIKKGYYEEQILRAWNRGELTPEEVAQKTGIPERYVYEVLPRNISG